MAKKVSSKVGRHKVFTILKVREDGSLISGRSEVVFKGEMSKLNKIFRELLKFGKDFDDTIKIEHRTGKSLVDDLNKVTYEAFDYFTEYKLIA